MTHIGYKTIRGLVYKNYMENKEDIIGLEEEGKKLKGIAEFSFNDREKPDVQPIVNEIVPKLKEEPKIEIKNGRSNRKSRKSELF
jgi:hypothetical protein